MAVYIYNTTSGTLVSWCPEDTDPVAPAQVLSAKGLTSVSGLPALDATHIWDATNRTVATITPPVQANLVSTFDFLAGFTSDQFAAMQSSGDPVVQQMLFIIQSVPQIDLNNTTVQNFINYLATNSVLPQSSVASVLAATPALAITPTAFSVQSLAKPVS